MTFAVSFSQLLLAAVFAVAGIAKLADRSGTRRAIEAFGTPPSLVTPIATTLPIAELVTAAALLPVATGRGGAMAAAALLVIFSLAIARTLLAGSAPDCNCFGGLTQTEVGRGTLVRNLLLVGLAGFVLLSGQSVSAFRWVAVPAARDRPGIVFMVACLAALGWFCWQLLQQNGRLLLRLEGEGPGTGPGQEGPPRLPPLEPGTPAPAFAGLDLHGEPVSLSSLLARGLPVALFFTDPGCGACELVLDVVARAQRERADTLTVAVISSGRIDRIEEKAAEFGLDRVVPQADDSLLDAYRVPGFPAIVEVDADGSLLRTPALGADPVRGALLAIPAEPGRKQAEVAAR